MRLLISLIPLVIGALLFWLMLTLSGCARYRAFDRTHERTVRVAYAEEGKVRRAEVSYSIRPAGGYAK